MIFKLLKTTTQLWLILLVAVVSSCGQAVTVNSNPKDQAPPKLDKLFNSPETKFSIRLPDNATTMPEFGEAKKTSNKEDRIFEWSSSNGAILVQVTTDLTGILVKNQDAVLAHALDFGIKSVNGKLISDEPVTLGSIRGRQIEVVDSNGIKMFAKAYVTGNEVFLVIVAPKRGVEGADKVMKEVLDSFSITDQPKN